MNKKIISRGLVVCLLSVLLALIAVYLWQQPGSLLKDVFRSGKEVSIVIDPGHGGMDGGAESRGGVCEKDINLSISKKIRDRAEAKGWGVLMTRDEDEGLYDEGKGSIRAKKNQDLRRRKELINDSGADAAVSIHLNSYPSQSVKGAQTFYSSVSSEGKELAERIQEKIRQELDPENDREPQSKDDIIIMQGNTCPLVLIECGFLSNDREAELLQDEGYQDKIAAIVVRALEEHFGDKGKIKKNKNDNPVVSSK